MLTLLSPGHIPVALLTETLCQGGLSIPSPWKTGMAKRPAMVNETQAE